MENVIHVGRGDLLDNVALMATEYRRGLTHDHACPQKCAADELSTILADGISAVNRPDLHRVYIVAVHDRQSRHQKTRPEILGAKQRPLDVVDLRHTRDETLLETFYREVYLPSFPVVSEQENPDVWRALLWDAGQPCELHCLVAGHDLANRAHRQVLGGHLFEFYPHSACGLLTYLVVHPSARRRGLGSWLFRRGLATLRQAGRAAGSRLRRVFAEVDDPRRMRGRRHPIDPWERLRFFEGLGGRVFDLPYVQPELVPGQGRARHLLLLTMYPRTRARAVAAAPMRTFLAEFYRALNVASPEDDADFRAMLAAVRNERVPFLDVRRQ